MFQNQKFSNKNQYAKVTDLEKQKVSWWMMIQKI